MKLISPSALLIVIIAFALPFCDLRCNKLSVARINGYDFIVGKDLAGIHDLKNPILGGVEETEKERSEMADKEKVKPNPFAIAAFLCAIAGIAVFFGLKNKSGHVVVLGLSLIGLVCMLLLKVFAEKHLQHKMASGLGGDLGTLSLYLEFLGGYYLAVAGFVVSLVATGLLLREQSTESNKDNPANTSV